MTEIKSPEWVAEVVRRTAAYHADGAFACRECDGNGFNSTSDDPDTEVRCEECIGTGAVPVAHDLPDLAASHESLRALLARAKRILDAAPHEWPWSRDVVALLDELESLKLETK